jgi:hypothetical protein
VHQRLHLQQQLLALQLLAPLLPRQKLERLRLLRLLLLCRLLAQVQALLVFRVLALLVQKCRY